MDLTSWLEIGVKGYGNFMVTRRNRPNDFILNDGSDDEALPEDRI